MALTKQEIEELLQRNPSLADNLRLKTSAYWPEGWTPSPKQAAFLILPHKEAFYGGAAGGGKSDALLACVLQYVDIPGFAALVLRKTLSDLKLPGSLLSRAHEWLGARPDCLYKPSEHTYYFPTLDNRGRPDEPSKVTFGYIGQEDVRTRYQGAEFQTVAFDELTQHQEDDYLYLFSRLRKRVCKVHKLKKVLNEEGKEETVPNYVAGCWWCDTYKSIPVRMRSASNPGNMGHQWVKDRFRIRETTDVDGNKRFTGTHPERPYIPAFVSDNVYIDQASYLDGLNNLDPITRARLKAGDWSVSVDSRFKRSWARYYSTRSNRFILGREGRGEVIEGFSQLFAVVDPAGSSKEGPGDTDRYRKQKSWTVVGVFGLTYDYQLLLLDVRRERVEIPDIIPILKSVYRQWAPQKYLIEGTGLGRGVFQMALRAGLPCVPVFPHADKVVRSTAAQVRMEQGRIWFPEPPGPSWLETWEGEVFTWTGHPHETDDQVDVLAHAANHIAWEAANMDASLIQPNGEGEPNIIDVPFVIDNRQFFNGGVAHLPVQF